MLPKFIWYEKYFSHSPHAWLESRINRMKVNLYVFNVRLTLVHFTIIPAEIIASNDIKQWSSYHWGSQRWRKKSRVRAKGQGERGKGQAARGKRQGAEQQNVRIERGKFGNFAKGMGTIFPPSAWSGTSKLQVNSVEFLIKLPIRVFLWDYEIYEILTKVSLIHNLNWLLRRTAKPDSSLQKYENLSCKYMEIIPANLWI